LSIGPLPTPSLKISCKSIQKFLLKFLPLVPYVANRQTNNDKDFVDVMMFMFSVEFNTDSLVEIEQSCFEDSERIYL